MRKSLFGLIVDCWDRRCGLFFVPPVPTLGFVSYCFVVCIVLQSKWCWWKKKLFSQLRTMNHSARRSMKNAANCAKYGELQGSRNRNVSNAHCAFNILVGGTSVWGSVGYECRSFCDEKTLFFVMKIGVHFFSLLRGGVLLELMLLHIIVCGAAVRRDPIESPCGD